MKIILIRHGETDGNAQRIVQPPATPLNQHGMAQAERVAQRLESDGIEVSLLCSSDLARAQMTAEPIARRLGVEIDLTANLQERNFGDLRGRSYDEIGIDIMADDYDPPSGESWPTFHKRVADYWEGEVGRLQSAAQSGPVILVTHGLVLHSLAAQVLNLEPDQHPERWGNTCVTVFDSRPPHDVEVLACVAHLEDGPGDDAGTVSGI